MAKEVKSKSKSKAQVKVASPPAASSSGSEDSSSASSSSSSSSRESSEEPEEKTKASSTAAKGKGKAVQNNRYVDVTKYKAPKGMVPVRAAVSVGLDWSELEKDPELELWAIRVPVGVKAKYLEGVTIQLPSGGGKSENESLGSFTSKKNDFKIFLADNVPIKSNKKRARDEREDINPRGGQEMHSLIALVPNHSRQDKLFQTRSISKHILIERSLPPSVLSHLPSSTSSLIASQPSSVPGAIMSAEELLNPEIVKQKKVTRPQPRLLRGGLKLGGMGSVGGKGLFDNKPVPQVLVEEYEEEEEGDEQREDGNEMDLDGQEGDVVKEEAEPVVKKQKKEKKDKSEKKEKKEKKEKLKKEA